MYWIGEVRRAVERRGRHGTVGKDRLGAAGQGEARSDKTTQGRREVTRRDEDGFGPNGQHKAGADRFDSALFDLARRCKPTSGDAIHGRRVPAGTGKARHGRTWQAGTGLASRDGFWLGQAQRGPERSDVDWRGPETQGRLDPTCLGAISPGTVAQRSAR